MPQRLIPRSVSYLGEITTINRALFHFFRHSEFDLPPTCKGLQIDFDRRLCTGFTTLRTQGREIPASVVGDAMVHCCNPWHVNPLQAAPSPSVALIDELPRTTVLQTLIEEWTSANAHQTLERFMALYVEPGEWEPQELSTALAALIERKDMTPRWRGLLAPLAGLA